MSKGRADGLWAPQRRALTAGLVLSITFVASEAMAVLSTAWVVPGLAGPAVAAEVAHAFGWRWVFLGLLPVVAVAGSIAVPALIRLGPPAATTSGEPRLIDALRTAAGATLLLAGL